MKNVLAKLQNARMALIAMTIKKGARNEFAKYNYMELADFLIPAQGIFSELGLVGVVSFTAEIASLTITDLDSGEQVVVTSPMSTAALKGCHEVQNLGAVQTYLRRYLWVAALEIVEHDAIDSSKPIEEKPVQLKSAKPVTKAEFDSLSEEEQQFLRNLAMEVLSNTDEKAMFQAYQAAKKSLDADEQVAFWSLFDSKQRSAIKRIGDTLKQMAA